MEYKMCNLSGVQQFLVVDNISNFVTFLQNQI